MIWVLFWLIVVFIIICILLLFDIFQFDYEIKYIDYIEHNGYIDSSCIIWKDMNIYKVISQYKERYNISTNEKLYVSVYYNNYQLSTFDIVNEHRFNRVSFISGSDIKFLSENKIRTNILKFEDSITFDKYGNIIYN